MLLNFPVLIAQAPNHTHLTYPLAKRAIVSSPYGPRNHPIDRGRRFHYGIDFAAPTGSAIVASHSGKVIFAGWKGGYGLTVMIEGDGIRTLYAHASRLLVKTGELVQARETIAEVGSTGNSTGPHLHFEVHQQLNGAWIPVNPAPLID